MRLVVSIENQLLRGPRRAVSRTHSEERRLALPSAQLFNGIVRDRIQPGRISPSDDTSFGRDKRAEDFLQIFRFFGIADEMVHHGKDGGDTIQRVQRTPGRRPRGRASIKTNIGIAGAVACCSRRSNSQPPRLGRHPFDTL